MSETYRKISGKKMYSLSSQVSCEAGDQFLISRKQLRINDPEWWFSRRISYGDLSECIFRDLSANYRFGSMAFELSSDYARAGHSHTGYNYVEMTNQHPQPAADLVEIAKVKIDDAQTQYLRVQTPVYPKQPPPSPGEVKIMSVPTCPEIDVYSKDFDGWVYPDGSVYPNEFEHWNKFEAVDGQHFKVPHLTEMIYLETSRDASIGDEVVEAVNDMSEHDHTFKLTINGNIQGKFKFKHGGWKNGQIGTHGTCNNKTSDANISFQLDISNLKFDTADRIRECESNGKTTHPTYQYLPMLIYIGKKI